MNTVSSAESVSRYWTEESANRPGRARIRARIGGLHCSLCTGTIEKALGKQPGVDKVAVSLTHEQALIASTIRVYCASCNEKRSEENLSSLFLYIFFGTVIGARLAHVLFYQPEYFLPRPWEIFMIWQGGLASHGGFAGVLIAIYLYLRKYRDMSFLELADQLTIPPLFAASFIRIGNFFNSEVIGLPSKLPWAIIFLRVDNIPRHPAMLYEAAAYFLAFCVLYTTYWKTRIAQFPAGSWARVSRYVFSPAS